MALRLIEAVLPGGRTTEIARFVEALPALDHTLHSLSDQRVLLRVILDSDHTEGVLDQIDTQFGSAEGFRAVVLNVEATLPRPVDPADTEPSPANGESDDEPRIGQSRISREELYHRVSEPTQITAAFTITVCLSTIVAAVGLLRGDLAVIIGAMVIAPLLGPNVALALATTLGDGQLMRRALQTNLYGVTLALALSLLSGWFLTVDPEVETIMARTRVGVGDIVLAVSAGSACALAYTTAVPAALIGVMVAVALLPPLVVAGLLTASGEFRLAMGAALLVSMNVICVNLAGVVTFLWQGIRPRSWWEADRARQATRRAIMTWLVLLAVLGLLAAVART